MIWSVIFGAKYSCDRTLFLDPNEEARRKVVTNGNADFSFISGGIVPGILILKPDFPENHEDWPFFWGENEYVVNLAASYIFLANAADKLLNQP